MKHSLTVLLLVIVGSLGAFAWLKSPRDASNFPAASLPAPTPGKPVDLTPAPAPEGQQLMEQAAVAMAKLPAIEAKLRVRTHLLGQDLIGSGAYYQLAGPHETMLKLELKLQVADQVSSLLQVSDGRFLWVRRDLPSHQSLSRIDQRRIQEALAKHHQIPPANLPLDWTTYGGLAELLEVLAGSFQFGVPRQETMAQTPVYVLDGHWKPAMLAHLWPEGAHALQTGQPVDLRRIPDQLPHAVRVVLSRDARLPLFPHRIEYLRVAADGQTRLMVGIDLFDVRNSTQTDPRFFYYKPGDQEVAEETEQKLQALGL